MHHLRWSVGLAAACFAAAASADIDYVVSAGPGSETLKISVTAPVTGSTESLQMPRWAPGSYRYVRHFEKVTNVTAVDENGKSLAVSHPEETIWTANTAGASEVTISYEMPVTITDRVFHYAGPSTYMYMPGRIKEACTLEMDLPASWKVACGLQELAGNNRYTAPDYDVLTDNPVTAGEFVEDTYYAGGVEHTIAYHSGGPNSINRQNVIDYCRKITIAQGKFFDGLPFRKYIWHFRTFNSADGAGGLEHLSSTEISLATGLGLGAVSVLSHEYFHAWNVKRIRSSILGPFDYQELPQTGALWWLEGVTDYYADVLLRRPGVYDNAHFYGAIISNVDRTRRSAGRLTVSPYESSYRVRDAANGIGNSSGYGGVNYYNTGWVAGLCLDLELRHRTGGQHSLDDVTLALWEMCKDDQPGFKEEEIRKQLIRFGGAAMGGIYDKWIMNPGELPVEEQLAKVGLEIAEKSEKYTDIGFRLVPSRRSGGIVVRGVQGPADDILKNGDLVVSINGTELGSGGGAIRAIRDVTQNAKVGESITLGVKDGGQLV
jgi:predicted metalloprotease with PDZ domain